MSVRMRKHHLPASGGISLLAEKRKRDFWDGPVGWHKTGLFRKLQVFLATSLLVLRYYGHLFLFSMLILHVTSSQFCLHLLNIYHFTYTFSHAHTDTHTSTHVQSAYKRNGDNQTQEPGWERRKKEFVRDLAHTHTQNIYIYLYIYINIFFRNKNRYSRI